MLKKRNAQAAMEFLMTYGWAILVVLVVVGALAYFGVLNPGQMLPSKCTLPPGMSCRDFKVVSSSGTIKLNIVNGLGRGIVIQSILVNGTNNGATTPSFNASAGTTTLATLRSGDNVDVTLSRIGAVVMPAPDPTKKYRWDVNIRWWYDDSSSAYAKESSGELLTSIDN